MKTKATIDPMIAATMNGKSMYKCTANQASKYSALAFNSCITILYTL
jgi:hypothetical protein